MKSPVTDAEWIAAKQAQSLAHRELNAWVLAACYDDLPPELKALRKRYDAAVDYVASLSNWRIVQRSRTALPLAPRELEVARLIAEGLSIKEIAGVCSISVHTARRHSERIYAKLRTHKRHEIARSLLAYEQCKDAVA